MERFQEKDLPLRCVLRMQKKREDAWDYIRSCQPIWDKALEDGVLRGGTVFGYDDHIFVYYESTVPFQVEKFLPDIADYVHLWPGQEKLRPYVPMIKVYQSMPMEEVRDWEEKGRVMPKLTISRMKMDMLQDYTYYHYQMQEELPGYNGRYLAIWGSEDWCVLYNKIDKDRPIDTDYVGKLNTHDCPADNWNDYMIPIFNPWPDGKLYQTAEILLHVQG